MAIYFCVLILVCFCVLCSVFVFLLNLGQEDEADGADGVDVDQGIENCGASSQPKSTQNNFLLKYKLERGIRDPERGMGDTEREISEIVRDDLILSHPSHQERMKSAHIIYWYIYIIYTYKTQALQFYIQPISSHAADAADDDDDDEDVVKTE